MQISFWDLHLLGRICIQILLVSCYANMIKNSFWRKQLRTVCLKLKIIFSNLPISLLNFAKILAHTL